MCMLPAIAKFSLFLQSECIVGNTNVFFLNSPTHLGFRVFSFAFLGWIFFGGWGNQILSQPFFFSLFYQYKQESNTGFVF